MGVELKTHQELAEGPIERASGVFRSDTELENDDRIDSPDHAASPFA
jgi:hypothetical protein